MNSIFLKHRVNRIEDLPGVKPEWGVEIDLRSDVKDLGRIHLSHDCWKQGDDFEAWLKEFKKLKIQGPIVLNTKEDGLESRILELISQYSIQQYFFLDTAIPTLVRWSLREKHRKFAVRLSKYEPYTSVTPYLGHVDWVWVDCFDGDCLSVEDVERVKKDFKVCLVSPELQNQSLARIREFKALSKLADAICTKDPDSWLKQKKFPLKSLN